MHNAAIVASLIRAQYLQAKHRSLCLVLTNHA